MSILRINKNRLINNKGLSAIEAVISVAFLALLFLGGTSLISSFYSQQVIGQEQEAVNRLKENLSNWFQNEVNCNDFLAGKVNLDSIPVNNGLSVNSIGSNAFPLDVNIFNSNKTSENKLLKTNDLLTPQIRIQRMALKRFAGETNATSTSSMIGTKELFSRTAVLELTFDKTDATKSTTVVPRGFQIHIPVFTNNAGLVETCQVEVNKQLACESSGGVWSGTKCEPGKFCRHYGAYITVACDGAATCNQFNAIPNPLTGTNNCPSPSTASLTFSEKLYSHNVSCGKKCSKQVHSLISYYTCLYCN